MELIVGSGFMSDTGRTQAHFARICRLFFFFIGEGERDIGPCIHMSIKGLSGLYLGQIIALGGMYHGILIKGQCDPI